MLLKDGAQNTHKREKGKSIAREKCRRRYSGGQPPRDGIFMSGALSTVYTRHLLSTGGWRTERGWKTGLKETGPAEAGPARLAIDVPDVTHKKAANHKMARLLCALSYRISTPDRCCFQRQLQYRLFSRQAATENSNFRFHSPTTAAAAALSSGNHSVRRIGSGFLLPS